MWCLSVVVVGCVRRVQGLGRAWLIEEVEDIVDAFVGYVILGAVGDVNGGRFGVSESN